MQSINICQNMLEMSAFRLKYCLIASMDFVVCESECNQRQYFELENFKERFRLSRTQRKDLLLHIGPDCVSPTGRSMGLTFADKLLMVLRFYASGTFILNY